MHHAAIHRHAQVLPSQRIRLIQLLLRRCGQTRRAVHRVQRLTLGSPDGDSAPEATGRDRNLANRIQDVGGFGKGHQAAQPDRILHDTLTPMAFPQFQLLIQGEKDTAHSSRNRSSPGRGVTAPLDSRPVARV